MCCGQFDSIQKYFIDCRGKLGKQMKPSLSFLVIVPGFMLPWHKIRTTLNIIKIKSNHGMLVAVSWFWAIFLDLCAVLVKVQGIVNIYKYQSVLAQSLQTSAQKRPKTYIHMTQKCVFVVVLGGLNRGGVIWQRLCERDTVSICQVWGCLEWTYITNSRWVMLGESYSKGQSAPNKSNHEW